MSRTPHTTAHVRSCVARAQLPPDRTHSTRGFSRVRVRSGADLKSTLLESQMTPESSAAPNKGRRSDTQRLSPTERTLLAALVTEFGSAPFTSARAAALLARHVRGVGTFLGRAARSGELIPCATGSAQLRRVRTISGRLSLWAFEPVARDPDEDVL